MFGLRQTTRRVAAGAVAALLAGSIGIGVATSPAVATPGGCQPGSLVVTNNLDGAAPPMGSLRAEFAAANAAAGPQTICVATTVVGPIVLTTAGGGELVATAAPGLTLQGNGITIQAAPNAGIIDEMAAAPLTLDSVTLTGANNASVGGAVNTVGDVTIINSTLANNTSAGRGGGVNAVGDVTVLDSTLSANTAGGDGGGVCSFGNVTVTSSTLSNNTAGGGGGDGGGVCAFGNLTVTNSTISNNSADGQGGGLDTNGVLTLVYSTVVQNTASTGANLGFLNALASFGSVVALAQGIGANCSAPGTTNGFNFSDDTSCGFAASETHLGVDPRLGPLANNGGPTQTRPPQPASPLLDVIPVAHCSDDGASAIKPLVDQRGVTRPQGPGCDAGAVEVEVAAPAPVAIIPRFTG